ncbi:MAG: beta-propeller fold lactonase family protein [Ignavibacteriales bacterium]|nr:beta-propeller fold lactonase family protein [Ignavibacteriales bacterium]
MKTLLSAAALAFALLAQPGCADEPPEKPAKPENYYPVTFTTHPEGAFVTIFAADSVEYFGATPFDTTLPEGPAVVRYAKDGFNERIDTVVIAAPDTLERWLDLEGQLLRCVAVFECGNAPKAVEFTEDRSELWATMLAGPPSVEVYDATTWERTHALTLGKNGAVELAFIEDSGKAYASQMETASIYEIDMETKEIGVNIEANGIWTKIIAVSPDKKTLYLSNWVSDDVSEVDLEQGKTTYKHRAAKTPRGLYPTPNGRYLYVACFGNGAIKKIDLEKRTSLTLFSGGIAMRHIVPDTARRLLFITDLGRNRLWKVDLATDEVTSFAKTAQKPNTVDITPDGKLLFVSSRGRNNPKSYLIKGPEWGCVQVFDATDGELLDVIVGGNQCTGLDVSADGKYLAFSDFLDDKIRVYEIPPYEVLKNGGGGRSATYQSDVRKNGEGKVPY